MGCRSGWGHINNFHDPIKVQLNLNLEAQTSFVVSLYTIIYPCAQMSNPSSEGKEKRISDSWKIPVNVLK
jgi:hypothetical protein